MNRRPSLLLAALIAGLTAASAARAQTIDGLSENQRVFNDYPNSALTIVNSNTIPGNVVINDVYSPNDTAQNGANRHDVLLSDDGGATAATFSIDDAFSVSAEFNLTSLSEAPRKETGIRLNSSPASGVGDALFLINSDGGEIVAFGGGTPFFSFGNDGGGNGYTPGETIQLGYSYFPSGGGAGNNGAGQVQYFINRGAGIEFSPLLDFSNTEGGPVDFQVGLYAQGGFQGAGDFFNSAITNISFTNDPTVIPEPSSIALTLLAVAGGLAMIRRRK